jgi:2-haloacid dehalogenase
MDRKSFTPSRVVVFDLGGVLVDWNPRYLYRKLLPDEAAVERFLAEVCTHAWNEEQDGGRSWEAAVTELCLKHPEHQTLIRAYDERWEEMLGGSFPEVVEVLAAVVKQGVPRYALSNWSAEKFPVGRRRFPFLDWFNGVVVSGEVKLKKPDPRIFQLLCERFAFSPKEAVFIDDVQNNISVAAGLGFDAHLFRGAPKLWEFLRARGLVP